ncbi:hypothetical protein O1L60_34690 [Streptomyces diastatochromogenes]|nr:hypothetical protein [Streptomyces diastatochromogenes]
MPGTDRVTSRTVTVRPGRHDIDVPVEVRGNTRYGYDLRYDAFVKAVRGTVVGAHRGGVTARNDDAMPTMRLTPLADDVTEGSALRWRVTLSAPADVEISGGVLLKPVADGQELSTKDVDPAWLEANFGRSRTPRGRCPRRSRATRACGSPSPPGRRRRR